MYTKLSLKDYPPRIEEKDLSLLLQRVREKDPDAIEKMILGHCRLAISISNRYLKRVGCYYLRNEMESAVLMAVVTAVNHVANDRMTEHDNVGGYIMNYIHLALSDCYRNNHTIHTPRGVSQPIILPLVENLTKGASSDLRELKDELRSVAKTAGEMKVLKLRSARYTDSEISTRLGISRLAVQRIRTKLKTRFEKREKNVN